MAITKEEIQSLVPTKLDDKTLTALLWKFKQYYLEGYRAGQRSERGYDSFLGVGY